MKPINKNIGFFILIIISIGNSFFGDKYIASAFLISALFYDAITNPL